MICGKWATNSTKRQKFVAHHDARALQGRKGIVLNSRVFTVIATLRKVASQVFGAYFQVITCTSPILPLPKSQVPSGCD